MIARWIKDDKGTVENKLKLNNNKLELRRDTESESKCILGYLSRMEALVRGGQGFVAD